MRILDNQGNPISTLVRIANYNGSISRAINLLNRNIELIEEDTNTPFPRIINLKKEQDSKYTPHRYALYSQTPLPHLLFLSQQKSQGRDCGIIYAERIPYNYLLTITSSNTDLNVKLANNLEKITQIPFRPAPPKLEILLRRMNKDLLLFENGTKEKTPEEIKDILRGL